MQTTGTAIAQPTQLGHLEADSFCECGYNLHGQVVTRDERLGIAICRCPECGRFHAAGKTTAATQPWLSRLGNLAIALWLLMILGTVTLGGWGLGALTWVPAEAFTTMVPVEAQTGRILTWEEANQTVGGPNGRIRRPEYERKRVPIYRVREIWADRMPESHFDGIAAEFRLICLAVSGCSAGLGLLAVFLWHLRRPRVFFWLLLPVVAGIIGCLIWWTERDKILEPLWELKHNLIQMGLQVLMMAAGLLVGRPVARGLLRVFIPPRVRQHLAFLWWIDGKTVPPIPEEFHRA